MAPVIEMSGTLRAYLRSIRAYDVLSREAEHDLAVRYVETRDPALARQLVQANLRYVCTLALRYRSERTKLLDLIQEGNLGLMRAVEKFDPSRGIRLVTFAGWWINACIKKFVIGDKRLVRIGKTRAERILFSSLRKTRARLEEGATARVTSADIAAELGVKAREVDEMVSRLLTESQVARKASERAEPEEWIACAAPRADELLERQQAAEALARGIDDVRTSLSLRDQDILDTYLLSDERVKLDDLAEVYGISKERVRQLCVKIKAELAERLRDLAAA